MGILFLAHQLELDAAQAEDDCFSSVLIARPICQPGLKCQ